VDLLIDLASDWVTSPTSVIHPVLIASVKFADTLGAEVSSG
jgi:hypothetical protein